MRKGFLLASFCVGVLALGLSGCGSEATKSAVAKETISAHSLSDVFEVIDFLPGEELPSEVKFPSIQIQFSEPVVALQKLGEKSAKSEAITIDPPLAGTFRWYGTSLLSFESSEEVIPQRRYTVKVNPDLVSASGKTVSGALEFAFHTEELALKSVIPGYGIVQEGHYIDEDEVPVSAAGDLALVFNAPVDPRVIQSYVRVTDENLKNYTFDMEKLENPDTSDHYHYLVRLTLTEAVSENVEVTVTLSKGAIAEKDGFPTSKVQKVSFHTITPFALEGFEEEGRYFYYDYSNPVFYTFSAPLDPSQDIVSCVSSDVGTALTAENIVIKGNRLIVHGLPVRFNSTYHLTLSGEIADIYGRKVSFSTPDVRTVQVPAAASFASFKNWGFKMLEAQFEPRLAFQFQNVKPGSRYTVTPLTTATGMALPVVPHEEKLDEGYPQDTKIVKTVDLAPYLQKSQNGEEYHGALRFDADILYDYRYKDWRTDQITSRIEHQKNEQVVQVTDLGITVRYGYNKAAVMVTSLKTGEPVPDAQVSAFMTSYEDATWERLHKSYPRLANAKTNSQGLAVLDFKANDIEPYYFYIEAKTHDDRAVFIPDSHNMWRAGVVNVENPKYAQTERHVTFLFTDRGLYKPGETVTFRGIDRLLQYGEYAPFEGDFEITLQDSAWRPTVYETQKARTSANGTFWGTFTVPEDLEPGVYELCYKADGVSRTCSIQVQFFEKLRFEVNANIAPITYYSGDSISADIEAQYLGGGSLNDCTFSSFWTREPVSFRPKGTAFETMSFGPMQGYDGRSYLGTEDGMLSGEGKANVLQKTGGEKLKGRAYRYRMEANIVDSGNQSISASAAAVVHPASFYIGIGAFKNVSGFAKKGDTLTFDYVCLTPDAEAPAASFLPKETKGALTLELLREDWKEVQQVSWDGQLTTRYERIMVSELERNIHLSGTSAGTELSVVPPKGGAYILRLSTTDAEGRDVVSEKRFYVTSSDWYWYSRDYAEEITLTPDKESYSIGDKAQVLMQSPLPAGRYLITLEREGIISEEVRVINEPTTVLSFDIKESYVPIMYVAVSSYSLRTEAPAKDYNTKDIGKPKGYFGVAALSVTTAPRSFDIAVKTDKALYRPGETATISLKATTKDGKPVSNAEITLMAVDRGVIDLINYHVPDPVAYFYDPYRFPECVRGGDSRSLLMDPITYTTNNLVGGDADDSKLEERKHFDPTAVFVPALMTDANGNASYTFTLPDSLTAYRITAIGVDKNNFSRAEDELSVANPVSVRTVQPRKLRLNDQGELGATISNLEGVDHTVSVSLSVYDGLDRITSDGEDDIAKLSGSAVIVGEGEKSVLVGAQKTQSILFNVLAQKSGWITVEYVVRSDVLNERVLMPLEIEKPYIYETVATVGEVSEDSTKNKIAQEERIILPSSAEDGMGSLYVQLDPTRLGVLREAINYVFHYPYGCLEQRSSAIMPLVAFSEYIQLFGLDGEVKNPKKVAEKEMAKWATYQRPDGGFPYWPDGMYSNAYVSARIAEIVSLAKSKGYKIPAKLNTKALTSYLVENASTTLSAYADYSWAHYSALQLYYAASCLGAEISQSELERIVKKDDTDVITLSLCGLTYMNMQKKDKAEAVMKKIKRYMKQTTRGVEIAEPHYGDYWSFFSDQSEKYALCLQLWSQADPSDSINAHLVYELLSLQRAQKKGYWSSTAATCRVLISLNEYIRAHNLSTLNFTAEVLLNDNTLAQGHFEGVGAEPVEKTYSLTEEPLAGLPRDRELSLSFVKDGTGTLFYTAALQYAIPVEKQVARDEGLCIFTEITDVKTGEVVSHDTLEAGKIYKEKVFISSTRNREFVAVRAPIPAGAEIMNAAFVTTGTLPKTDVEGEEDEDSYDDWYRNYNWGLSYEGIYDTEVQYFWDYFPRGSQSVEFMFRAVRKGEYNTPSSTAECMYQEEIFGRSNGKVWTIE